MSGQHAATLCASASQGEQLTVLFPLFVVLPPLVAVTKRVNSDTRFIQFDACQENAQVLCLAKNREERALLIRAIAGLDSSQRTAVR